MSETLKLSISPAMLGLLQTSNYNVLAFFFLRASDLVDRGVAEHLAKRMRASHCGCAWSLAAPVSTNSVAIGD
jgi:hypothetical protein